jgi:putative oxidoreductase
MNGPRFKIDWLNGVFPPRTPRHWVADLLLLGARLYAGITIALAGLDKLPTPDWMVEQVIEMKGFPAPEFFAFVACYTEFLFGVLLALGLLTPAASLLLAFTLAMAAFNFQGVAPITGMHIAQHFFWLFVVFLAVGPGRFSIDHLLRGWLRPESEAKPKTALALGVAAILVAVPAVYGLYREWNPPAPAPTETTSPEVESINLAGSFNEWDLTATPMTRGQGRSWSVEYRFEIGGPIEFKFAANESWDLNVGEADQDSAGFPVAGTGELGAGNIRAYIPAPGTYRFTINEGTLGYQLEPTD